MYQLFKRFKRSEKGQGMVEYGLILALVSIVSLGALGGIGGKVNDTFDKLVEDEETVVPADFIPVATAEELAYLNESKEQIFGKGTKWEGEYTSGLDKKYIQVSNLDLNGIDNFEPIGMYGNEFKGTFDGGGYEIKNLTVDKGDSDYAGLFGRVDGATLTNIGLVDVDVKGRNSTGGLVGQQRASSKVVNSYATGSVTGTGSQIGGLVGYQYSSSTVSNSYATGSVNGTRYNTGGLVGLQDGSSVSNSYATGTVNGGDRTGGLVGGAIWFIYCNE